MATQPPLMPKATASWLVDNTALSFDQIAAFCQIHPLEVQALADGEVNLGIMGANPLSSGELTQDEISRCEKDVTARLKMNKTDLPQPRARSKGPRYTPVTKRAEKPGAILFLIKKYPDLQDVQIARLIGSTKPTVDAVRNRTHANSSTLKPVDPLLAGLCTGDELEKAVQKAERRVEREAKKAAKIKRDAEKAAAELANTETPESGAPSDIVTESEAPVEKAPAEETETLTQNISA